MPIIVQSVPMATVVPDGDGFTEVTADSAGIALQHLGPGGVAQPVVHAATGAVRLAGLEPSRGVAVAIPRGIAVGWLGPTGGGSPQQAHASLVARDGSVVHDEIVSGIDGLTLIDGRVFLSGPPGGPLDLGWVDDPSLPAQAPDLPPYDPYYGNFTTEFVAAGDEVFTLTGGNMGTLLGSTPGRPFEPVWTLPQGTARVAADGCGHLLAFADSISVWRSSDIAKLGAGVSPPGLGQSSFATTPTGLALAWTDGARVWFSSLLWR